MDDQDWLAERFEGHRSLVAYRMLGSPSEADDAVQEAWFRLNRSYAGDPRRLMLCAVGTTLGFAGRRV
jgi:DNA-directed RNA polymerase specialized sigma24 family protein